jgi:hypothetical protein
MTKQQFANQCESRKMALQQQFTQQQMLLEQQEAQQRMAIEQQAFAMKQAAAQQKLLPAGQYAAPVMDEATVEKQKASALKALGAQSAQKKAIAQTQLTGQLSLIDAENQRNTDLTTQQYLNQSEQQKASLQQQFASQKFALEQQEAQRQMQIDQQAMTMTAAANQQKLQREMQQKMTELQMKKC